MARQNTRLDQRISIRSVFILYTIFFSITALPMLVWTNSTALTYIFSILLLAAVSTLLTSFYLLREPAWERLLSDALTIEDIHHDHETLHAVAFENRERIYKHLQHRNDELERWRLQQRWKTPVGHTLADATLQYIRDALEHRINKRLIKPPGTESILPWIFIDLSQIKIQIGSKIVTLQEFPTLVPIGSIYGDVVDLRGFDFRPIKHLQDSFFEKCFMTYAIFDDCYIGQVFFISCNLVKASFKNSYLVGNRLQDTAVGQANFSGAFINAMSFEDSKHQNVFAFSRINYFHTLRWAFGVPSSHPDKRSATDFYYVDVSGLSKPASADLKQYIIWYERLRARLEDKWSMRRFRAALAVLFTGYWNSLWVWALWCAFTVTTFAVLYSWDYLVTGSDPSAVSLPIGRELANPFWQCLYFSVVTFTTLGFGDVHPTSMYGMSLVMIEVVFGYVALGLFITMVGWRIQRPE